jgi:outer-membrane receptor for ferric coprogen and ferric-rhodotorulic acid
MASCRTDLRQAQTHFAKSEQRKRLSAAIRRAMAGTAVVSGSLGSYALADAPSAATAQPVALGTLEEVVVQARKLRPDDQTSATGLDLKLVDTPQAVTVITPQMLALTGATNIYEAADLVPGLQRSGNGYGIDSLYLRGTLVTENRINGDQFRLFHSLNAFAVERTEVVRGPATALYGVTGGFGGEINSILKAPLAVPYAEFGFRGGYFDLTDYQADVSGPIPGTGDHVRGRLLGDYTDYSAPVDVVHPHNYAFMTMGSLAFDFTDKTSSTLWVYYQHRSADPYDGGFLQKRPDGSLGLPPVPPGDWYFSDPAHSREGFQDVHALWDFKHSSDSGWNFKAQTAFNSFNTRRGYYFPFGPAGAYALPENQVYFYSYDQEITARDLTFDMSLGRKFEMFGHEHQFFTAFEYEGDTKPAENIIYNSVFLGLLNIFQGGRGVLANGQPVPVVQNSQLTIKNDSLNKARSFRYSANLLLKPIDRVDLLVGGLFQRSTNYNSPLVKGGIEQPASETEVSFHKFVPRAGVTYGLVENSGKIDALKTYFNYSEGFDPNIGILDSNQKPVTDPQLLKQYELGLKGEFLDHALGSSLAAYDSTVTNIPAINAYLGNVVNGGYTLEGKRHVKGIEWEAVGRIHGAFNLVANYTFTQTSISDPNYKLTIPVKSVPKHRGGIFPSYVFEEGPLQGLQIAASIVAESKYSFLATPGNVQRFGTFSGDANTQVGLSFSYRIFSGRAKGFEIYGNGNNIFNKILYVSNFAHPGFAISRLDPRAYTLGVRMRFGNQ